PHGHGATTAADKSSTTSHTNPNHSHTASAPNLQPSRSPASQRTRARTVEATAQISARAITTHHRGRRASVPPPAAAVEQVVRGVGSVLKEGEGVRRWTFAAALTAAARPLVVASFRRLPVVAASGR